MRKCIVSYFDTCVRVLMKFIKDSSEHSEWKTDADGIAYDIWRRGVIGCSGICNCCI